MPAARSCWFQLTLRIILGTCLPVQSGCPVRITAGLEAIELDPNESVETHIREVSQALHQLMPVTQHGEIDKHMALSRDAPGMHEAALLERIADIVQDGIGSYDLIVFDTAPSGHTARLMVLPEMMSAWTEGLIKRREKADRFAEVVRDLGGTPACRIKPSAEQTWQSKKKKAVSVRFFCGVGINLGT